jgi:anti-sigma regulatory factor (Ser/Thr protein kinase)
MGSEPDARDSPQPWRLPWGPRAPAKARELTGRLLAGQGVSPRTSRETLLVVSELVTNAVQHASPPLGLHVAVARDRISVEVTDGEPTIPVAGPPPPIHEVRGRGLGIVEQLSGEWGWRRNRTGKTVWCWLPTHVGGDLR